MGCVSSKSLRETLNDEEHIFNNGVNGANHVVSLTSTSYGALKLHNEEQPPITECILHSDTVQKKEETPPREEEPEATIINAWELMEGLEEEGTPISNQAKRSPKSGAFLRGVMGNDNNTRSPFKFLNQFGSPKSVKKFSGKENRGQGTTNGVKGFMRGLDYSPKGILKENNSSPNSCRSVLNPGFLVKGSPICAKRNSFGSDSSFGYRLRRRSASSSNGKGFSEDQEEEIKRMVWSTPKPSKSRESMMDSQSPIKTLQNSEKKCPQGGENSVVIYTTTLRGIRKTFEDCNKVRSIIESHCVHMLERDVSMDSGFKEELRRLMETKDIKVPLVFVKGSLIGGVDEVLKLEEEGKLSSLFEGMPRALSGVCEGCCGVRFVMCWECDGCCKVLDKEDHKNTVRCGKCNENGLVQCPLCCLC